MRSVELENVAGEANYEMPAARHANGEHVYVAEDFQATSPS